MASTKTVAKGIRIANECAEYFEGKPLNRMVESLMGLMESGVVTYDGEELRVHSENPAATASVNTDFDLPSEALKDIESMSTFCGMSLHDALVEFDRLLNEGALVIGDEINVELPSWTKRITEVCHDRCISVESMGKKIVEMIERGQI